MKLFLLEAKLDTYPFIPWYDKVDAMIIVADNEEEARKIASQNSGAEDSNVWLNSEFTICETVDLSEKRAICISGMWA